MIQPYCTVLISIHAVTSEPVTTPPCRDEPEHHPRGKTELACHQRGRDGVLFGIADHARRGDEFDEAIGGVTRPAERLVLVESVADVAVGLESIEHRDEPIAGCGQSAHSLLEVQGKFFRNLAESGNFGVAGGHVGEFRGGGLRRQYRVEAVAVA